MLLLPSVSWVEFPRMQIFLTESLCAPGFFRYGGILTLLFFSCLTSDLRRNAQRKVEPARYRLRGGRNDRPRRLASPAKELKEHGNKLTAKNRLG